MIYIVPESIHPEYEIVEKIILGKVHYGLNRVIQIGKIKFPIKLKVYDCILDNQRIGGPWSKRWHLSKNVIKSAIRNDRSRRIDRYIEKHVK